MDDSEIIKNRIFYESRPLARIYPCFASLKEGQKDALESFLFELHSFKYAMQKHQAVQTMTLKEIKSFNLEKTQKEREIAEAETNVLELTKQLEAEQKTRAQKLEYDAIAKQIIKLPSRAELTAQIQVVEQEMSLLRSKIAKIERTKEMRKNEFSALISTIHDIQSSIKHSKELDSVSDI